MRCTCCLLYQRCGVWQPDAKYRMPISIGSFSYTQSGLVSLARSQFVGHQRDVSVPSFREWGLHTKPTTVLYKCVKGLVHQKIKILSLITHPHVVPSPQDLCSSLKTNIFAFCARRNKKIMTFQQLFNNFFSFVSVFSVHLWEYHDACVWCCLCKILTERMTSFTYSNQNIQTMN